MTDAADRPSRISIEELIIVDSFIGFLVLEKTLESPLDCKETWNSAQCILAAWMGGEFEGEWIQVYEWLSLFTVHLKLSHIFTWLYPKTKFKLFKN